MKHPIKYRNYEITPVMGAFTPYRWDYTHEDHDGSPDDPIDGRLGSCATIEDCINEINEIESET